MINISYPSLHFPSSALKRLSEQERATPITRLGLSTRTTNVLTWRGVNTLGDLVSGLEGQNKIGTSRNCGRKSHRELVYTTLALSDSVSVAGAIDWKRYFQLVGKENTQSESTQLLAEEKNQSSLEVNF